VCEIDGNNCIQKPAFPDYLDETLLLDDLNVFK
jgi:hypothetical protein